MPSRRSVAPDSSGARRSPDRRTGRQTAQARREEAARHRRGRRSARRPRRNPPALIESLDLAIKLAEGTVILAAQDGDEWVDHVLSLHLACPVCKLGFEELDPRSFSFNAPRGACPACEGLGYRLVFDREALLADRSKSLADGAIAAWNDLSEREKTAKLGEPQWVAFLDRHRLTINTPLEKWSAIQLGCFFDGEPEHGFAGLIAELESESATARKTALDFFRVEIVCAECGERD